MDSKYQIGFASSDLFFKPTLVMLDSFFVNNEGKYIFNFLYTDTSLENRNVFKKLIESNNCEYREWKIDESFFNDFIFLKRFGFTTYFRIILPFIVENMCQRVLWIDSDTVVNGSVSPLFEIDLSKTLYGVNYIEKKCKEKLGLSVNDPYVNCGVLLYNCSFLKKKYNLNDAINFFGENKEKFTYVDQCFLNLFYKDDIGILDSKFNDVVYRVNKYSRTDMKEKEKNSIILHFVGNIKPWKVLYDSKMYKIYWKYAKKIFGKFYFFRWYVVSRICFIFKPFVYFYKKTKKVNI